MAVMFHFIFEIIKISILACIYSTLIFFAFYIIGRYKPKCWFAKISIKKFRFWFLTMISISVGLFFFMFTYFGDHGLGDSAKIPIGHFKKVLQIEGTFAFLQNSNGEQLEINNFTYDNNNLYAELNDNNNFEKNEYVIWDLNTDSWAYYKTKAEYLNIAKQENYPLPDCFEEFWKQYNRYWNGWRFWTLP